MGIYASDVFERETSLVFEQNSQEIHLLLEADVAGTIFTDAGKPPPWKGVIALKRKLVWTVMGKVTSGPSYPRNSFLHYTFLYKSQTLKFQIFGV